MKLTDKNDRYKLRKERLKEMKTKEIVVRDPYILLWQEKYYLYGTRSHTCWGKADGFDCYVSDDLEEWEGPFEVFHKPEDFFATEKYWAPECYAYQGKFYMLATFASETEYTQMYVLRAESPLGPFSVHSDRITPEGWTCIDGTIYFEENAPYLVFSHTFEDVPDGEMWAVRLKEDLRETAEEPFLLFKGTEAAWNCPIPFARTELGIEGDVYLTDGPGLVKLKSGKLGMTWSGCGKEGYVVGLAVSDSGKISGSWRQLKEPVYAQNGGHGMHFEDKQGVRRFVMHSPDTHFEENSCFKTLITEDETVTFED